MPYIWVAIVILTTLWAFWADTIFAPIMPFAATDHGWLIGLLVLTVGGTVLLTLMNMWEEKVMNSAAAEHDDHH